METKMYLLTNAVCCIMICYAIPVSTREQDSLDRYSAHKAVPSPLTAVSYINSSLVGGSSILGGSNKDDDCSGEGTVSIDRGSLISPQRGLTIRGGDLTSSAACRCQGIICNCSCQGFKKVPDNLPTNVTDLDLSYNNMTCLQDCAFCKYSQLRVLDISSNGLVNVDENSFKNLAKLESLNLQQNNISLNNSPKFKAVFKNLPSLTSLRLGKNKNFFRYFSPDEILGGLKNLQELFMDGHNTTMKGLRNMTSLRNLTLEGHTQGTCLLNKLDNSSFTNLTQLIHLDISTCRIHKVANRTFQPLQRLKYLNLSFNIFIYVKGMTMILSSLKHSNITTLVMNYINPFYVRGVLITTKMIQSLPVKLEHLEAAGNGFELFEPGSLKHVPENLSFVDLGNNRIIYGSYLNDLYLLKNLRNVTLSGDAVVLHLPRRSDVPHTFTLFERTSFNDDDSTVKDDDDNERTPFNDDDSTVKDDDDNERTPFNDDDSTVKDDDDNDRTSFNEDDSTIKEDDDNDASPGDLPSLNIRLPPNVQHIEMGSLSLHYIFTAMNVHPSNRLESLKLNDNIFPVLKGPLSGLEKLKYLDLRFNSINALHKGFFQNLTGLSSLMLGTNKLRDYFANYKEGSHIFYDLKSLTTLDLSNNDLTFVSDEIFESLENLQSLYMEHNNMWQFHVNISHLKDLRLVNLSHSQLSSLPEHVQNDIDRSCRNASHPIFIDLSFNPLQCDCDHLDFLTWMVKSCGFDQNFTNYMCKYPDESTRTINDSFRADLMTLNRTCAENVPLFLAVLAATVGMLGFVVAGILYRYRWKIRYFYYAAYIKLKDKHAPPDTDTFRYDVFISYAAKDEAFILNDVSPELSARGLKLLVHGRDFVVGDFIASNIVTAVKESRRTLVVLTRNLLVSTWCNYELQMANMESIHTGRPVLVFLLKESIPNNELGTELLYHIRSNTYILYPQDGEMEGNVFWDKVARDLKH